MVGNFVVKMFEETCRTCTSTRTRTTVGVLFVNFSNSARVRVPVLVHTGTH